MKKARKITGIIFATIVMVSLIPFFITIACGGILSTMLNPKTKYWEIINKFKDVVITECNSICPERKI